MLEIKNLNFSYKNKLILENINFTVQKGEVVSILGLNGSGKTTLLKSIANIETPDSGAILIEGENIYNFDRKKLAKTIGYLPQKYYGEIVTVYDSILLGRKVYINFSPSPQDIEMVDKILDYFHLKEIAFRNTNELSGGELQKVLIARAVVQEPKILLLDEPINHLDIYNQIEVMSIIRKITKKLNIITIIVMHDINIALRFSDKFILLKDKKIFKYGDKKIITPDTLKEVYNIDTHIIETNGVSIVVPKI